MRFYFAPLSQRGIDNSQKIIKKISVHYYIFGDTEVKSMGNPTIGGDMSLRIFS